MKKQVFSALLIVSLLLAASAAAAADLVEPLRAPRIRLLCQREPAHREETVAGLKRAAGFLRSMLGARIKVHSTPELHFVYDESVETGIRLTHLIDEAVAADAAQHKPRRRTSRSR